MKKVYPDAEAAVEGVMSNMTLIIGGFGLCGIPENCIDALAELNVDRADVRVQQRRRG